MPARAGQRAEAERSLARAYELDAGNPIIGYNLAPLLYQRGELERAQFYIRRINNSELANAETLWLGIKVEQQLERPRRHEPAGRPAANALPAVARGAAACDAEPSMSEARGVGHRDGRPRGRTAARRRAKPPACTWPRWPRR